MSIDARVVDDIIYEEYMCTLPGICGAALTVVSAVTNRIHYTYYRESNHGGLA